MGGVRAAAMLQGQSLIKEFIGNQGLISLHGETGSQVFLL